MKVIFTDRRCFLHLETQPLRKKMQVFSELHVTLSKEFYLIYPRLSGFSAGSDSKESACNAGDLGLIPGLRRSPGEGKIPSSVLARGIPWTEEPGGLQCLGSQKVGHD